MLKKLSAAFLLLAILPSMAMAEQFGESFLPTGSTKQISASTSSASTTLAPNSGPYALIWNEGTVFAYVTCTGGIATVPGGSGPNSTPVGPNSGILLNKPFGAATCAAITASSTANVDFTPGNLF